MQVEVVVDVGAELAEGPVWHDGALLWVDIMRGHIHRTDVARGQDTVLAAMPGSVGAVAAHRDGGYLAATDLGFVELHEDGSPRRSIAVEADIPDNRMNDGKCDPAGRFWAGTMALDASPGRGSLYVLGPDGDVRVAMRDLTISNGLGWSPDARTMYLVDSGQGTLASHAFDLDGGVLGPRNGLVEVAEGDAVPDGLTVDADGGIWVALWGGGRVHRYAPNGGLDQVIELPVSQVTSCAFGGPDLRTLFITTAAYELDEAQSRAEPLAGAVFAVELPVGGLAPVAYAPAQA